MHRLSCEESPIVVIDVGCRWGFADKFIQNDNVSNILIYGFDPDKEECKRLTELYDNDNIKLVPIGLDEKSGNKILYLTKEPGCSSLYAPNKNLTSNYPALSCAKEVAQVEVSLTSLDEWAKSISLKYIDYMKIDTQGAELSILKGGKMILPTMRYLEVEVEFNPIYDGQPTFSDIDIYLRKFGFVLWKFSNFVHYSQGDESEIVMNNDSINFDHHRLEHEVRGGQIFWADAFYVKKEIVDTQYNKGSLDALKRDAMIAGMLGFHDLEGRLNKKYMSIKAM